MISFRQYLSEETETKLKHIHHAEDRPLLHGASGFEHTVGALTQAHTQMKSGKKSSGLTMKYDGSPSIVFGRHPETGRFFVASKSAFNKNPKINYTEQDIEQNHGHAPGLVAKLKHALKHLPKVTPGKGVYQGDVMFSGDDVQSSDGGASFTPNTITYTASGDSAKKIKRAKFGVVVHTKYAGKTLDSMKATPNVDAENFTSHPDVYHHTADYDTSRINYPKEAQKEFEGHVAAAKAIHEKHGAKMYGATSRHGGEGGHLSTYINATVRSGETPSVEGFRQHVASHYGAKIKKLKMPNKIEAKHAEAAEHEAHILANQRHYANLLGMHGHLQAAKNVLVKQLEQNPGGYGHSIGGKPSQPEGFVVNHGGEPTKLVNRAEFARQNLLKSRRG